MINQTDYSKEAFIALALHANVLKFGDFTLKSGRKSPYFFNAGLFYDGVALQQLGCFYARKLLDAGVDCSHVFGPAYKGLPLATATAIGLASFGVNAKVTFNRKEAKDHGEGGQLIGAPLQGNIVMVDDVITAGTAFRESQALIQANNGHLRTVIIALNRCERGSGKIATLEEIEAQGVTVLSIINFHDLVEYLSMKKMSKEYELLVGYKENIL